MNLPLKLNPWNLRTRLLWLVSILVVFVGLDQWTKQWIVDNVARFQRITVIPHVFHIVHVHNRGAAFGILSNLSWGSTFLTCVAIFAILCISIYYLKAQQVTKLTLISLTLILSGALGNLIDRIRYGFVIDFIDWHYKDVYHWPAFNIADSCVTVAVTLLILELFFDMKRNQSNQQSEA